MARAAINKTLKLSANGILGMDNNVVVIENADTGECIPFDRLLSDFMEKPVKFNIVYDYDYDQEA